MASRTVFTCDRCNREIEQAVSSLPVITVKDHDGEALLHHAGIQDLCQSCTKTVITYLCRAYKIVIPPQFAGADTNGDDEEGEEENE